MAILGVDAGCQSKPLPNERCVTISPPSTVCSTRSGMCCHRMPFLALAIAALLTIVTRSLARFAYDKTVIHGRKGACTNLITVLFESSLHIRTQVGILFDKPWRVIGEDAEHILGDENLPITLWRCSDAERRN